MVTEKQQGAEATTPRARKPRTMKVGRVVSNKMEKTVVVAVDFTVTHRLYKKAMRRTHKFKAHDEQSRCQVGDRVRIEETRPISKEKHWIVREIIPPAHASATARETAEVSA